jgi:hypothetical protein
MPLDPIRRPPGSTRPSNDGHSGTSTTVDTRTSNARDLPKAAVPPLILVLTAFASDFPIVKLLVAVVLFPFLLYVNRSDLRGIVSKPVSFIVWAAIIVVLLLSAVDQLSLLRPERVPRDWVALSHLRPDNGKLEIVAMDPNYYPHKCVTSPAIGHPSHPSCQAAWSPDRQSVAFSYHDGETWNIGVSRLEWRKGKSGSSRRPFPLFLEEVVDRDFDDTQPAWSEDGLHLLFIRTERALRETAELAEDCIDPRAGDVMITEASSARQESPSKPEVLAEGDFRNPGWAPKREVSVILAGIIGDDLTQMSLERNSDQLPRLQMHPLQTRLGLAAIENHDFSASGELAVIARRPSPVINLAKFAYHVVLLSEVGMTIDYPVKDASEVSFSPSGDRLAYRYDGGRNRHHQFTETIDVMHVAKGSEPAMYSLTECPGRVFNPAW